MGEEIAADLARPHPMHRLLQGEVGSGKTLVSVRAMLQVIDSGGQAAMLAPTEVLATQHFRSIGAQLGALGRADELDGDPAGTQLTLVTGSLGAAARRAALAKVADGERGDRDRHARPALRGRRLPRPRPGGGGRAAPVRGGAAGRVAGQGRAAAARAGDDRDADPPHGRHDGLRRPGDLDAVPAAAGPFADRLARGAGRGEAGLPGPRVATAARGGAGRPSGLCGVPADRRRGLRCAFDDGDEPPSDNEPASVRRSRSPRSRRFSPRVRCTACGSASCTAGCRPTRRTR